MKIDPESIEKMKLLVEKARKAGKVLPVEKAFEMYPPEGTWHKDENGKITVKEYAL